MRERERERERERLGKESRAGGERTMTMIVSTITNMIIQLCMQAACYYIPWEVFHLVVHLQDNDIVTINNVPQ